MRSLDFVVTSYKICSYDGRELFSSADYKDVENWKADNAKEHPDWRICGYSVIKVTRIVTQIS